MLKLEPAPSLPVESCNCRPNSVKAIRTKKSSNNRHRKSGSRAKLKRESRPMKYVFTPTPYILTNISPKNRKANTPSTMSHPPQVFSTSVLKPKQIAFKTMTIAENHSPTKCLATPTTVKSRGSLRESTARLAAATFRMQRKARCSPPSLACRAPQLMAAVSLAALHTGRSEKRDERREGTQASLETDIPPSETETCVSTHPSLEEQRRTEFADVLRIGGASMASTSTLREPYRP
mmetsp:Transcript_74087/g.207983  ORF Transcript_74087/g.207983 Transcript_74087/m.207983 type:complete len:235 (+) Transcript_74087:3-707(+)